MLGPLLRVRGTVGSMAMKTTHSLLYKIPDRVSRSFSNNSKKPTESEIKLFYLGMKDGIKTTKDWLLTGTLSAFLNNITGLTIISGYPPEINDIERKIKSFREAEGVKGYESHEKAYRDGRLCAFGGLGIAAALGLAAIVAKEKKAVTQKPEDLFRDKQP